MSQNLKVSVGEVIVFTEGEYSDFGIDSYLVFIKDCDLAEMAQEFAKTLIKDEDGYYLDKYEGFAGYLIGKEIAVPVAHRQIHLGGYGEFKEEFGVPKRD